MPRGPAIAGSAFVPKRPSPAGRETSNPTAGQTQPAVGNWQLTRLVGQGQWTRVYRARPLRGADNDWGDFAVKVLSPEYAADPLARALLRREAQVSRHVQHPHLATVLADHSGHEQPHLVLPFLEGTSLRRAVDGGLHKKSPDLLPVPTALLFVRQIAAALAALHEAGWLHGDVKPANIHVAPSGHATLLDMGLARRLGSEACLARYMLAATLAYAAPECFSDGQWLSSAADVYSLGIVLFELLTQRQPFVGDAAELVTQHRRHGPPDVQELRPDVGDELAEILRRMLAKEPLRRPETARLVRLLAEQEILLLGSRSPQHALV